MTEPRQALNWSSCANERQFRATTDGAPSWRSACNLARHWAVRMINSRPTRLKVTEFDAVVPESARRTGPAWTPALKGLDHHADTGAPLLRAGLPEVFPTSPSTPGFGANSIRGP